jgi:RimJ/RimL family protein N-acetyltransferase
MQIRGTRVHLRPLATGDTDLILRWRSQPAVASQLFSAAPSREEHEKFLRSLEADGDREEFVIVLNENDEAVGTVGLSHINRGHGEAEYGILIGEDVARGKGIAREASELILEHAFRRLHLRRVILNVFSDNAAAIALYRRLGFRDEPHGAEMKAKDGVPRRALRMVIEPSNIAAAR